MVETLSELLESAANVAEDNGGKLSIASAAVLIAEAYEFCIVVQYRPSADSFQVRMCHK